MGEQSRKYNDNLHDGAKGKLYQFGRELRQSATNAETILWQYLRNRKLNGLKFRRQHPVGNFVADFYCHEKRLIVELDGSVHVGRMNSDHDEARTNELEEAGIKVIRFWNSEVEENIEFVLEKIAKETE